MRGRMPSWIACLVTENAAEIMAPLRAGREKAGLTMEGFDVVPTVPLVFGDDPVACADPLRFYSALYVGGMGSKEENFHKRVVERAGYGDAAQKIQDLWLAGRQKEAVMAVPDELADSLSLIGSRDSLREKLARWTKSPATTLLVGVADSFEETVKNMEVLAAEAL